MESIYCDENIEIFVGDRYPSEESHTEKHKCACGRSVCCGKHKNCCKQEQKIRFIKGKERSF
jgi:hypothetical protein